MSNPDPATPTLQHQQGPGDQADLLSKQDGESRAQENTNRLLESRGSTSQLTRKLLSEGRRGPDDRPDV